MRETQIVVWCDACQARGKATKVSDEDGQVTVDLGAGRMTLDLCKADRKAIIEPLSALVEEWGVPAAMTPPARGSRSKGQPSRRTDRNGYLPCPKCNEYIRGARRSVVNHLVANHRMNAVAASKLVPTANGKSVPCPVCGYITDGGTGMSGHIRPAHGADVWEKVKAERAGDVS